MPCTSNYRNLKILYQFEKVVREIQKIIKLVRDKAFNLIVK